MYICIYNIYIYLQKVINKGCLHTGGNMAYTSKAVMTTITFAFVTSSAPSCELQKRK